MLLLDGVSMEVISELLGLSKITVTQQYCAKVVMYKVSYEIFKFKK